DPSWSPDNTRRYFERLENCHHSPMYRWLSMLGLNSMRHGWGGWLQTEMTIPESALGDKTLAGTVFLSAAKALGEDEGTWLRHIKRLFQGMADPNDWRRVRDKAAGICYTPLATHE